MRRPASIAALLFLGTACSAGGPEGRLGPVPTPAGEPTAVAWEARAPAPTERTEVAAAADGERIYVAGGFAAGGETVPTVEVYDVATDAWSPGPDLPLAVNHPMAAAVEGTVYVLGGYREALREPTDRAFALRDGAWEELPPMPEPRAAGGAAAAGGRIYVVGGVGPGGLAEGTLVFDPATGAWSTAPGLPTQREHLGVAGDGELVYAVGGRTGGIGTNLGAAEVFDPETGGWTALPDMPTPRGGIAAAATANGFIVAPGGEASTTFADAEAYDVRSERWVALSPMPTPRHGLGVVALGDVVFVIAGGPEPGFAFSGANEVIDLGPLRG